jgi:hypothetical protein
LASLQSKTLIGLLFILAIAVALQLAGKLSAEMVDVLKYVGGFYFGVRGVANYAENMGSKQ